jgi:hypothetical protein
MTRRRRTPMVSTHTFAHDERIFREGDEIDGQDAILDTLPGYFVPVGTPRSQWPRHDPPPRPEPAPSAAVEKRMVVAKTTFTHPSGHVVLLIYVGDQFDADSTLGRTLTGHYPNRFQPVEV